jgi:hypothetical protein
MVESESLVPISPSLDVQIFIHHVLGSDRSLVHTALPQDDLLVPINGIRVHLHPQRSSTCSPFLLSPILVFVFVVFVILVFFLRDQRLSPLHRLSLIRIMPPPLLRKLLVLRFLLGRHQLVVVLPKGRAACRGEGAGKTSLDDRGRVGGGVHGV